MDYATFADLVRVSVDGWVEIAQACHPRPAGDAGAVPGCGRGRRHVGLAGGCGGRGPGRQPAVQAQISAASRYADDFIGGRYPGGLTPDQVAASDLPTVVATIALRRMYGAAVTEEVLAATKWADDFLKAIASRHGQPDAGRRGPAEAEAEVLYDFSARAVTDDTLRASHEPARRLPGRGPG